jgi:hypothetical protein
VGSWRYNSDILPKLADATYSGFAVIALDRVVLESLWGFRKGKSIPQRQEQHVYRNILMGPSFGWTQALADDFRTFVRNGLMHDAETRKGWLIEKTIPHDRSNRTVRKILIASAFLFLASSAFAQFTPYYGPDSLTSINTTDWGQNGTLSASGGLTSTDADGGSLISKVALPVSHSEYEIISGLTNPPWRFEITGSAGGVAASKQHRELRAPGRTKCQTR